MFRRFAAATAAAIVVITAVGALIQPAAAAASSLYATGLTFPSGAIVDPNGRVWVADHFAGFCRIVDPTASSPGFIEHPQFPGDTAHGSPTCMGGLLAGAGTGADATSTPSFVDPTPAAPGSGDEIVLVPDGAAPSSDVYRFQWNPTTALFDFKDTVLMIGSRVRPNASALGPDGNVYVVFQKTGDIQRINDPAGAAPTVEQVGRTSDGRGAIGVTAGRDVAGALTVYVGGPTGVDQFHPDAATRPVATASPANIGADAVNALGYDLARDQLFIGTGNAANAGERIDVVHRYDVVANMMERNYATGFTLPAGFGVRPDGNVLIVDEDAGLPGGTEGGTGRMFLTGLPGARITSGPTGLTNTASPVFTFVVDAVATAECSVNGAAFAACTSPFTVPALPDGPASFAVRAITASATGLPATQSFTVDTVGPIAPTISSPADGAVVNGNPAFAFSSEPGATFKCSLDGAATGPFTACAPGSTFTFSTSAAHTLFLQAVDAAGNPGDIASTNFTVDLAAPSVSIDSPLEGANTGNSPVFMFSSTATDLARFECSVDGGAFASCTSPTGAAGLVTGTHTFTVRAVDTSGNAASTTRTIHVGGTPAGGGSTPPPAPVANNGYWLLGSDGGIFTFGTARFFGSTGGMRLNQPVVGMAPTPSGNGYWLVARDGGIFTFGDAAFFGSTGGMRLNQPIVGMASTPSGNGYWLVARDGGIFSFGDAAFFGSTGSLRLNQPILGMARTANGRGYWLYAADGGIFTFGNAVFHGSTGRIRLNQPISGMAPSPSGNGYWLVARDGGVFSFGDAAFFGSAGGFGLTRSIVGLAATAAGNGYRMAAADGGIFAFGGAGFFGSAGALHLSQPIISIVSIG